MKYSNGSEVLLGDTVDVPVPDGNALARVVMLGDSREHLEIEAQFLEWVESEDVLRTSSIIIEWTGNNPLGHNDPNFAPVGNYMFTVADELVTLVARVAI